MHISSIRLQNFGPFHRLDCDFTATGLNVIHGRNESGKSQLLGSALAAILGEPVLRLAHGGASPSSVRLEIVDGSRVEVVSLTATESEGRGPKIERAVTDGDGQPIEGILVTRLRDLLAAPRGPRLILDGRSRRRFTRADLFAVEGSSVFKSLPSLTKTTLEELAQTEEAKASEGLRLLGDVFHELAVRSLSSEVSPLLVDDLHSLDYPGTETVWKILETIASGTQVVCATHDRTAPASTTVDLDLADRNPLSLVYFGGRDEVKLSQRTKTQPVYRAGEIFPGEEDRQLEFKEIRGSNPVSSIVSVVDQYVVAFLNSTGLRAGSIYWGVRDSDREIVGVRLTAADRDKLRRVVTDKLHKVTPTLAPSAYSIEFHPVRSGAVLQSDQDLCLVQVLVPAVSDRILFATGRQEVYVKTDGGKKKLTALEIQRELIGRLVGFDSGQ